jgi:hypothetical protein
LAQFGNVNVNSAALLVLDENRRRGPSLRSG